MLSRVVSMLWWHFRQCTAKSHLLTVFFTENQTCRHRLLTVLDFRITYPRGPNELHETEIALWEQMTGIGPCPKQKQTRSGVRPLFTTWKWSQNLEQLLLHIVSPLDVLDIFTEKNKRRKVETTMCFIYLSWYLCFFHVREENLCLTRKHGS